jgi:ubiquinone/menaquinone biosynthesis C-methylase UbiE
LKQQVRDYWQQDPCGSADAGLPLGTRAFFEEVERQRFAGDEFMFELVGFDRWKGKDVLEVGCGLGTDLLQFARGGARVHAVDLTDRAVELTRKRLDLYGFHGEVGVGDAEHLPYPDDSFDLVYSWGVIHLTDDPGAAAREIVRVTRPGGSVLVMVYNRRSLFSLQAWILYGLLRGEPRRPLDEIVAQHVESPGTRVYTPAQAAALFPALHGVRVRTIVTRYDLRVGRRTFLPAFTRHLVPSKFGWFLVVEGMKPR